MKIDNIRELALKSLYKIDTENAYSNIVLDEVLNKNREKINNRDIGFISELVYGVTTWKLTLDCIIQKYSKLRIKKISKWIINILRLGAYQIIFLDKIPKSAAVNESVNLSKKYGAKSSNFVNAILRKIEKKDFEELQNIEDDVQRISKTTSMPEWIVEELLKDNEITKVEEICRNSNIKPKISIRVNTLKTNRKILKQKLDELEIKYIDGILEDFLYLENVKNITSLEIYKQGLFTMQDEAAGLTSLVLMPKEGEIVLDCCSAPGGKTTHLAEIMNNKGKILAWDLYENRLNLVKENANRLGINIIETNVCNSTDFDSKMVEKFDKVLLDVPCLGLGVIRRKPDIKWQRKKEDIQNINNEQLKIINNCSKYLKKGGLLLYSTCSIINSENDKIIQEFLKENKFEIVNPKNSKIEKFKNNITDKLDIKLYPNNKNDGFYMCLLRKIG